jgi:hypothetical protein
VIDIEILQVDEQRRVFEVQFSDLIAAKGEVLELLDATETSNLLDLVPF